MSVIEEVVTKKERSETHHGSPRNPDMVLNIIEWRDEQKMTWQAIGKKFDITRAGARHLYHKWYEWYKEKKLAG